MQKTIISDKNIPVVLDGVTKWLTQEEYDIMVKALESVKTCCASSCGCKSDKNNTLLND